MKISNGRHYEIPGQKNGGTVYYQPMSSTGNHGD
jgi:hypothetical protein